MVKKMTILLMHEHQKTCFRWLVGVHPTIIVCIKNNTSNNLLSRM